MCNFPSGNFPKVRLGPLRRCRLQWGPRAAARMCKGPKTMDRTGWGPSAAARTDLPSCSLGNFIYGKMPFGKKPLGKYLTSNFTESRVYIIYLVLL